MPEFLTESKNGKRVFTDVENTNLKVHLVEDPRLLELLKKAIEGSVLEGENIGLEYEAGRIVGTTNCVRVTENDEIVYAKRLGRDSYSKFVKNRVPEPTSTVAVVLFQKDYGYLVWSAWCGNIVPVQPNEKGKMVTVPGFWDSRALVYDPQVIQKDTERSDRPVSKE